MDHRFCEAAYPLVVFGEESVVVAPLREAHCFSALGHDFSCFRRVGKDAYVICQG